MKDEVNTDGFKPYHLTPLLPIAFLIYFAVFQTEWLADNFLVVGIICLFAFWVIAIIVTLGEYNKSTP